MYKILFLLFISLFFVSCGEKNNAFRYFEKDDMEIKSVQYTKKADIVKDKEVDVIFVATYLNKVDKEKFGLNEDSFLVSLYFSNKDSQDIFENGYSLTLNNTAVIFSEKIEKNDERFKSLMLKNSWGTTYFVKFNPQNSSSLSLSLKNDTSNKAQLNFEK
jgi:hypothetical protein